jgi:hypothetical protein
LAGDYNGNGVVDAADYTLWRDTPGGSVSAATGADGNGDGMVDALDYSVWKTNFGQTLPILGPGSAAATAPALAELVAPDVAGSGAGTGGEGDSQADLLAEPLRGYPGARYDHAELAAVVFGFPDAEVASRVPGPGIVGANNNVADTGVPAQGVGASNRAGSVLRAAIISRSEMATTTHDDALLLWASERPKAGPQQENSIPVESSCSARCGKANDTSLDAVDDVFAALAAGV